MRSRILIFCVMGLLCLGSTAKDFSVPKDVAISPDDEAVGQKIDDAISWLVTKRIGESQAAHPILDDPSYRTSVRVAAIEAGNSYNLPPLLLLSMAYRESVLTTDRIGSRGEIGLMQVGKQGQQFCKNVCGQNITPHEQMYCGACWLDAGRSWCKGSLEGGLRAYAGGKCYSKKTRVVNSVYWRLRVWRKIHEMVFGAEMTVASIADVFLGKGV
jgi:hypothetical protein